MKSVQVKPIQVCAMLPKITNTFKDTLYFSKPYRTTQILTYCTMYESTCHILQFFRVLFVENRI